MTVFDPYTPESGSADFTVEHYDLDLDYRLGPNRLAGTATLTVRVLADVRTLTLDLVGLGADRVRVDGERARHRQRSGRLLVTLPQAQSAGDRLTVEVRYSGTPEPRIDRKSVV